MKIINYQCELGVPGPTHPTPRLQPTSEETPSTGPARPTEGQNSRPVAAPENRRGSLMARRSPGGALGR